MSEKLPARIYNAKDEVMLLVCLVILQTALTDIAELTKRNPNWTAAYIADLQKQVNDAFNNVLGIDPHGPQRDATEFVHTIQDEVLPLLSTFTTFLAPVFANNVARKDEVLKKLGFPSFYKKAQARNVPALVELLFQFQTNMTSELKAEITATKDISVAEIDAITKFADKLKQKNVDQKTFQSTAPTLTAAGIDTLNGVYTSVVIYFSKLVLDYFKKKKSVHADAYSFGKLKKIVDPGSNNKGGGSTPPTNPPTPPTT